MKSKEYKKIQQSGFSMIEILITLVIVATALLGTAGLQAYAMKTNLGGQFRNQAVFLANDIAERMEANKIQAVTAPGYSSAGVGGAAGNCDVVGAPPCTPVQMAQFDLVQWQAAVAQLPQGVGTVIQTVAGNPATYTITVTWVDRATNQNYAAGAAVNGGAGESFSVTTTKSIRN